MTALTLVNLQNAALDVAFIGEVSTSSNPTATDRLGNTKPTLQGAIDSLKAFNSRGAWAAGTAYYGKDLVLVGGTWYACVVMHVAAATFAADSDAKWRVHQGLVLSDLGSLATQDASDINITGGAIGGVSMNGARNTEAIKFAKWIAALARARAGGPMAKIAIPGDSTGSGVGSNPASATTDSRRRAFPQRLAEALTAGYNLRAHADSLFCDGFEGANLQAFDPRITMGAGWSVSNTFVAGGKALIDQTGTSSILSFNPGKATDTLDLYYVRYAGYADVIVSTGGVFNGSTSTAGTPGIGKLTVTRTGADEPWDIQKSAATPTPDLMIVGFDAYLEADHNVSVWNMGASGSKVSHWAIGAEPYDFRNALAAMAPDLTIIPMTINDWASLTPEVSYKADMQTMIDAGKVTGDVVLVVGVPSNLETASTETQQRYASYVYELADLNDLPVIDLSYRWISQAYMPGRGFYFDGIHPSYIGYSDIAQAIARIVGNP